MQIDIPISCPTCDGRMHSIAYEATLKVLKPRSWQICKDCGFQRTTEDFKKSLYCQ